MGYEGPESGPGAVRFWDDPDYGDGRFTILAAEADVQVRYQVEVEGGIQAVGAPVARGVVFDQFPKGRFARHGLDLLDAAGVSER